MPCINTTGKRRLLLLGLEPMNVGVAGCARSQPGMYGLFSRPSLLLLCLTPPNLDLWIDNYHISR